LVEKTQNVVEKYWHPSGIVRSPRTFQIVSQKVYRC
jgi:hypothetical protein